jgi:DNA modification methylase
MLDLLRKDAAKLVTPSAGQTDPDYVPEPPAEPTTRSGDLIVLGNHRLLCGDSTDPAQAGQVLEGESVAMVFTDPPYGVSYQSRVDGDRRKNWGAIAGDDLRGEDLRALLSRAIPPIEPRYVCGSWETFVDFHAACGPPRSVIVWDKEVFGLGKGYRRQWELVLFYGVLNSTTESDVWRIAREGGFGGTYEHPTQKPIALVERALRNSSAIEDVIYDPFMGSGTTLIACERLGRRCIGLELEPKYCDVIVRRWAEFTGRRAERIPAVSSAASDGGVR